MPVWMAADQQGGASVCADPHLSDRVCRGLRQGASRRAIWLGFFAVGRGAGGSAGSGSAAGAGMKRAEILRQGVWTCAAVCRGILIAYRAAVVQFSFFCVNGTRRDVTRKEYLSDGFSGFQAAQSTAGVWCTKSENCCPEEATFRPPASYCNPAQTGDPSPRFREVWTRRRIE